GPDGEPVDPLKQFLVRQAFDAYPSSGEIDYEPDAAASLRAIAARKGISLEEAAYDALLENEGRGILFLPIQNFPGTLDPLVDLLASEDTVVALGDGGAHLGLICDASYPTFLLTYWV